MTSLNSSPDELYKAALEVGQLPFTGRQIVTFNEGAKAADMASALGDLGPMAAASDFAGSDVDFDSIGDAATVLFEQIGSAILTPAAMPVGIASAEALVEQVPAIASIEPELFAYPCASAAAASATWGLMATNVLLSRYSGQGIKVAVLDTGMDLNHADFVGRIITSSSFVPNEAVQDLHSHGTHCIGTACGPLNPVGVKRYGIAHNAQIYAGKVLANSGRGSTGGILAGINWAIANGCQIISMSLGSNSPVQNYYTQAGQRALASGSLIIAASGNDSNRPGSVVWTGAPANSSGIVAVAALDQQLQVAYFSNGGKIEVAGPGVDVFSSVPMPPLFQQHDLKSGTSMATPHVAGIAALWAESNAAYRGQALANQLQASAKHLPLPASDVGAGLVWAP
jgi:subtilisin